MALESNNDDFFKLHGRISLQPGYTGSCYHCGNMGKFDANLNLVTLTEMERQQLREADPRLFDMFDKFNKIKTDHWRSASN